MFGFILGFVCLAALGVRSAKRHFAYGGHDCHGDGGHGCHGDGGHEGHGGPGRFSRGAQRWLFRHLQTTPGQETVIGDAFGELTRVMDGMREEARKTREDVAAAMRAEPLDQAMLDSAFARQTVQLQELQRVVGESLAKVHAVLDDGQRKRLAGLLVRFGWTRGAMSGEGPYRA